MFIFLSVVLHIIENYIHYFTKQIT